MEDLIYKLKEEHRRMALEFQRLSYGVSSKKFKISMQNVHDWIFSHLEHENNELYPRLEDSESHEARTQAAAFKSVNELIPGLKRLCQDIAAGKENYKIPAKDLNDHILNLFLQRFRREEELLFAHLLPHNNFILKVGS